MFKLNQRIAISLFYFLPLAIFAQKTSSIYIPAQSAETPVWFTIFYQPNFEQQINIELLDEQVNEYESALEKKYSDEELLSGEENENIYLLYYKRWRKSVNEFIQPDGSVKYPSVSNHSSLINSTTKSLTSNRSPTSAWSLVGPNETFFNLQSNAAQPACSWQVNIYSFAIAPSNNAILYAAPETGGIFKTSDKGLNWISCMDNISAGTFLSIAINPTNPNIVYAGKNGQVYKSIDGGSNWNFFTLASGDINSIIINPSNPNILFAGGNNGLFTSADGGNTWTIVSGMNTTIYDLFFQINNPNTVFVLKKVGSFIEFWKSIDGGINFAASINGWTGKGIAVSNGARMTVTPADANRIYAVLLGSGASPNKPFIFRSNDAGATWDTTCTGILNSLTGNSIQPLGMSVGQGYYDLGIIANPNNANQFIVASTSAYKSNDGGFTFNSLGGYVGNFSIHPDIQWMAANGTDTWIATDGGMNYSTDFFSNTTNFSARNKGIYGSDMWGFAQGWNEDIVAGGRYHNGNTVLSENYPQGKSLRLGGGEAPTGYYMIGKERNIVFSDLNPGVVVPAVFNGTSTYFSFNKLPNEDGYGWDASEVKFYPHCYNIIYSGSGNELWKSMDGGVSWTSLYNFNQRVKKFEVAFNNPNVIYVATANGFYKSTNAGANFSAIVLPTGANLYRMKVSVSRQNENILWITSPSNSTNNRVFKSIDGGASWINLTTPTINGQNYEYSICQDGTDGGIYIIAYRGKVFYRNNSMIDWADFSTNLPKSFGPLKLTPFYRDGKIRAAGDRGIWEIDLYEESAPIAQPTVDKISSTCVRDTFYFDDFSVLKHQAATWNWSITPTPSYINSTTVRNPKVLFANAGSYTVSLTVSNGSGTNTKIINDMITVSGNDCAVDTIPGNMLEMSATGDYAQQNKALNISTNNFTISCWIKPNGIQVTNAGIVFSGSGGACGLNFKSNNLIGYHWNDSPGTYGWSGGPALPTTEWSHIALVITPNAATVYLNGVAYTRTAAHPVVNLDQYFQFGIDRSNTARNFKGWMDEVCFYNRALSQNEIRELMNLTRNNPNSGSLPNTDNSLLAYYQFNEGNALPAYDKIGVNHAFLAGTANKSNPSSAPIGGGIFQRINVNTPGVKNFASTGVELTFNASSLLPNGDLVVTRINCKPDQLAISNIYPNAPKAYYIIRNYGSNTTFDSLIYIQFNNVQGTTNALVANPTTVKLFSRPANFDGNSWNSAIASSNSITNNTGIGSIRFSPGNNLLNFGQFTIGDTAQITTSISSKIIDTKEVIIFPNPTKDGWIELQFVGNCTNENVNIAVTNSLGQLIKTAQYAVNKANARYFIYLPDKGIFFVTIRSSGKTVTQKIIVTN
jgi:photosystem II stability/assembly factor-like uncharacterized protein